MSPQNENSCPKCIDQHSAAIRLVLSLAIFISVSVEVCRANAITPDEFEQVLLPLAEAHAGKAAIAVRLLDKNNDIVAEWSFQGDAVMPTASLIKLPVMLEAYRQADEHRVSMTSEVTLTAEEKVPGSGILTEHFSEGARFSLKDAIRLMIRYSDNTATNLVVDQIGLASTGATMRELGYPETQLNAKVFRRETSIDPERSEKYGLGSTTALDMVSLLTRMQRREIIAAKTCDEMLEHLFTCDDHHKFPRYLPSETKIAHKTGSVTRSRTAAGIIYVGDTKIVLCVLTDDNSDTSWSDRNAGDLLCSNVAKAAFELVDRSTKPLPTAPQAMATGAFGTMVEALQRTLNDRIQAGLSIDGDFGPATEAAVQRFQTANNLPSSGIVDRDTWGALGTLISEDDPVPPPDVVNSQQLEKSPPLDPLGPPATSAKAWSILDNVTGDILASESGTQRLPMASTTKIMTAYLVLELASSKPEVMEEVVVFSQNADQTPGSTSGIRAGEQVSVKELLYGLLLPSGNDASVALAEHFGGRVGEISEQSSELSPSQAYERFVETMNEKAMEIGLSDTRFANTHGLPAQDHFSSANDLARLAHAALKLPGMGEYVSTRRRGCRLTSVHGYSRDVVWTNTNRLLSQVGFSGLKTGTTTAAGACLVACGRSADQAHIVVVLGSSDSNARYIDARNLFAWSWRQ